MRGRGVPGDVIFKQTVSRVQQQPGHMAFMFLVLTVVATYVGAITASEYAGALLDDRRPTTPILLRYVINPSDSCAQWDDDAILRAQDRPERVVRIAKGPSGMVLVYDGRAAMAQESTVFLASDC